VTVSVVGVVAPGFHSEKVVGGERGNYLPNCQRQRTTSFVVRRVATSQTAKWHLAAAPSLCDVGLLHRSWAVTWRAGRFLVVLGRAVVVGGGEWRS
jgi:hypothetical protein